MTECNHHHHEKVVGTLVDQARGCGKFFQEMVTVGYAMKKICCHCGSYRNYFLDKMGRIYDTEKELRDAS